MNVLFPLIMRLARLQSEPIDRLALASALSDDSTGGSAFEGVPALDLIENLAGAMHLPKPRWISVDSLDAVDCPCLVYKPDQGWGLLRGRTSRSDWVIETCEAGTGRFLEMPVSDLAGYTVVKLKLSPNVALAESRVFRLILGEIYSLKRIWMEGLLAGFLINAIALSTAFYSMQVYDRVVPTGAIQTLWVLTIGVILAIVFDALAKFARSRLFEKLIDQVDKRLAREVYSRFLAVRLDQLPRSVGSLAAQLKGYETVRGFLTSLTSHLLIDVPFVFLFLAVIIWLGGWLGLVPLTFLFISVFAGLFFRGRVDALSQKAFAANNLKTDLLIETIEEAETIKSGQKS